MKKRVRPEGVEDAKGNHASYPWEAVVSKIEAEEKHPSMGREPRIMSHARSRVEYL